MRHAPELAHEFDFVRPLVCTGSSELALVRCRWSGPDPVVLKVPLPETPAEQLRLFRDGTTLARRLPHPSLVPVLGTGVCDDGRPWIVMPWFEAGSLADRGPVTADELLHIGVRIADVLHLLHIEGVVHRDVKPGNILLDGDGEPVLADVHTMGHLGPRTRIPAAVFSPRYAAPEVLDEHDPGFTVRSEIHSLGATLAELLDDGPERPDALVRLLADATALEPGHRTPTMAALAESLRSIQRSEDMVITGATPPLRGSLTSGAVDIRPDRIAEAADQLARAVGVQWEAEASVRRLGDPHPLPVAWEPAPDGLVVGWAAVEAAASSGAGHRADRSGWVPGPEGLAGSGDDLARVLAGRVPTGRLLVLGAPGAGKTMLLVMMVLGLLADRSAIGGRVPVLLSPSSWDPAAQDLRSWLRDVLVRENPWLRRPPPDSLTGLTVVDELLDRHLVLPVLDGLDEMHAGVRVRATERVNDWLSASPDNRITVSCRVDDWSAMVDPPGGGVPAARMVGTAGVLVHDLAPAAVRDYLLNETVGDGMRWWGPVLDRLGGDSPVAEAFRIPLMVGLARTVYDPRTSVDHTPNELTDPRRFPDRASIELHLFDGFLRAAYRDPPGDGLASTWPAARAERWLRRLARHLGDPAAPAGRPGRGPLNTVDLGWWELSAAAPAWVLGAATALVPAVAVGAATALGAGLGMGLGLGLMIGVLVALLLRRRGSLPYGGPIVGIAGATAAALAGSVAGGLAGGLVEMGKGPAGGLVGAIGVGLAVGPLVGRWGGVVAGAVGGAAVGMTAGAGAGLPATLACGAGAGLSVAATVVLAGRRTPARGVRRSGWSIPGAVAAALCGGVAGWFTAGPAVAIVLAVAGSCLGLLNPDADLRSATGPVESLRRDRGTFLLFGAVSGSTILAGAALAVTAVVGVAGGLAIGLVFASLQATWGRYVVARTWLAARGEIPWRLMAFLDDAHQRRGVLRRVGTTYQFRHADLQRRLAGGDR